MTEVVRFRCNNCGHRFEEQVLSEEEVEEAKRRREPTSSVHCPKCHRTYVRHGWD